MRLSLFWRTFWLIALLIAASLFAWLQLFRVAEREPRAERFAWEVTSLVNITRAGLLSAQRERRADFLADLAREEGIRVMPAEPGDRLRDWPERGQAPLIESKLRERLGEHTRLAGEVNGREGLWIGFEIEGDPYWMLLDPQRLRRQAGVIWLGWLGIAVGLAVAGGLMISRVINRPLSSLAGAIDRVSRGELPDPLPERGPTELAAVNRRFNRMANDLAAVERDRAEALAGISHDIRTPLARLRLEIELAAVDPDSRASMADEIDRIDAIVKQFVDFARPEETDPSTSIDVADTVASVLDGFRHGPDGNRMQADVRVAARTVWQGSATTLSRILTNLIENARRYGRSPDGTVRIDLQAGRTPNGIELSVRDHGPGVPPEQLERLLRPFTRADEARSRHGGSGLGLAIVARLVRRHGGELRLDLPADGGLRVQANLEDNPTRL